MSPSQRFLRWTWKVQDFVPMFGFTSTFSFDRPLTALAFTAGLSG